MNKKIVPQVYPHMRGERCICSEKNEISCCEVIFVDRFTEVELFTGAARDILSYKAIRLLHIRRAIHAESPVSAETVGEVKHFLGKKNQSFLYAEISKNIFR